MGISMTRRFAIVALLGSGLAPAALAAAPIPTIEPNAKELEQAKFESQPNSFFEGKLKRPPVIIDGQHLHPKYQYYLEERAANDAGVSAEEKRAAQTERMRDPAAAARSRAATDRSWTFRTKVTEPMEKVEDRELPGPGGAVPVRIYTPRTEARAPLPVLLYLHGGGWLFGSVAAVDRAARLIANEADVIVVSVDYRMAPVHKFPAANADVLAAFEWVSGHAASIGADPKRIGVGGDSVGGLMSTVLALRRLREGASMPSALLLYYPAVDLSERPYASYDLFRVGFGLDVPFRDMMIDLALEDPRVRNHLHVSPINAASFAGMPPAIIATAGFDPLRDHGKALAQRLIADGVDVQFTNYASLIHGFMQFSGTIDDAEAACVESARQFGALIRRDRYSSAAR